MRKFLFSLTVFAASAVLPMAAHAGQAEDAATAQLIASNMKTSGQMKGYRIGVKCEDGIAVLQGTVNSAAQAESAIAIAQQTKGVSKVINEIEILGATNAAQDPPINRMASRLQGVAPAAQPMPQGVQTASATEAAPGEMQRPAAARPMPAGATRGMPVAMARMQGPPADYYQGQPMPAYSPGPGGITRAQYDNPQLPAYAWPSYAASPNYAAVTYPKQYSPTAWPYIGPFYPYPQVPLGWRKVTMEWDDGWWQLDFH